MNELIMEIRAFLDRVITEGRTVTIKADDIRISADEAVINGLDITVE